MRVRRDEQMKDIDELDAVGQLAAGVAHDFNNLLTIIMGNAEQVDTAVADPRLKAKLDRIMQAATRGGNILRLLLSFSGRQILHADDLDLNVVLTEILPALRSCLTHAIELELHTHQEPLPCRFDRNEFEEAVRNIVTNAVQAMPQGGRVTISTTKQAEHAVLMVTDTGVGMQREVLEHAFEPFFTTRDLTDGVGLGLSHVYGFAKQSGGLAEIESELGEGTRIMVYLPMKNGKLQRSITILVVDDELDILDVIGSSLESNFTVLCTESPHEALRLADNHKIGLLLTDISMPQMNGLELAERIRNRHPRTKVLLMTGYTNRDFGEYPLLYKPFRLDDLMDKVRETLAGPGRW